jgi:hypothetical protein
MNVSTARRPRARGPCRLALALLLAVAALVSPAPPALAAATLTVTNANDSGPGSLRQAIADATPGDAITFSPTLAGHTVALEAPLALAHDVAIDATALAAPLTLSGRDAVQVLAVSAGARATLAGLTIAHGYTPGDGGGIHNAGDLSLVACTLTANRAGDHGGAIANRGILTITAGVLSGNVAGIHGGAVYNLGTLRVVDSTMSANGASVDGGAIENGAEASVLGSTFTGNVASQHGGAIDSYDSLLVRNSTFFANSADDEGGAIYNWHEATVESSTFSANAAGWFGGGLYNRAGAILDLANTLIAHSPRGGDCFNAADSPATNVANLVADGSCDAALSGDPGLGPLVDHGGPTQTLALQAGSRAIGAGDAAHCPAADQRGVERPQGAACDIGAYEVRLPAATTGHATQVTAATATVVGEVAALDLDAEIRFEYGPSPAYGAAAAALPGALPAGESAAVRAGLLDLLPNTTYHYRVVAENAAGTATGQEATFATDPIPPAAVTGPATDVTATRATLHATVNAHNAATSVAFEFGPDAAYGEMLPAVPATVEGFDDADVSILLTGLEPETTYHYRVVAENRAGAVHGEDATFTTPAMRRTHLPEIHR